MAAVSVKDFTLLYVDELSNISEEVQGYLGEIFNDVLYATRAEDALEYINNETIHLVYVALDTDEADKVNIIRSYKSKFPKHLVFIATNKQDNEIDALLKNLSVDAILPLEFDKEAFAKRLPQIETKLAALFKSQKNSVEKPKQKSLSVPDAIDEYFKKTVLELMSFEKGDSHTRKMNYDIMKQFLNTAFNNLKEIDSKFVDQKLLFLKDRLESVVRLSLDMRRRLAYAIETSYENVFLKKQFEYIEMYEQFETAKEDIQKARSELGLTTSQSDEAKEKIKTLPKNSEAYNETLSLIKRLNGKNVDKVHEIKELGTLIEELDKKMDEFKARYFDEFKEVFSQKSDDIKVDIKNATDILAYRFDRQIWRRAKQSRAIKEHFGDGQVRGLISSKTYLEYHVSHIDEKIASESSLRLLKYLSEFNKTNKLMVALVGTNAQLLPQRKMLAESIDSSVSATIYVDQKVFLKDYEKYYHDVVIADFTLRECNVLELYKDFKEKFKETCEHTEFCINISARNKQADLAIIRSIGLSTIFTDMMSRDQFIKQLFNIL